MHPFLLRKTLHPLHHQYTDLYPWFVALQQVGPHNVERLRAVVPGRLLRHTRRQRIDVRGQEHRSRPHFLQLRRQVDEHGATAATARIGICINVSVNPHQPSTFLLDTHPISTQSAGSSAFNVGNSSCNASRNRKVSSAGSYTSQSYAMSISGSSAMPPTSPLRSSKVPKWVHPTALRAPITI
ncbi:unnamed protein product [Phytophthora lilii]|uniref:Unnamed protein product n=1 Tax=Phytophthora lilii TaxID=2077276 RepID=A0A9W6TI30_9STRA|nr:unnamed protein product [Phytophthora lilii]